MTAGRSRQWSRDLGAKTPAGRRFIESGRETLDMVRHYADHHGVKNKYDLVFPATNGRWYQPAQLARRGFNMPWTKPA